MLMVPELIGIGVGPSFRLLAICRRRWSNVAPLREARAGRMYRPLESDQVSGAKRSAFARRLGCSSVSPTLVSENGECQGNVRQ